MPPQKGGIFLFMRVLERQLEICPESPLIFILLCRNRAKFSEIFSGIIFLTIFLFLLDKLFFV